MMVIDILMAVAPWVFTISRIRVAWKFAVQVVLRFIVRNLRRPSGVLLRVTRAVESQAGGGVWTKEADWPALATWLFSLFLGTGMTFRVIPLRSAFDARMGIPNLGWFISFVAESMAIYVMACGCRAILKVPVPRWLHVYIVGTLLVFVFVFVTSLASGPERLEYTAAGTPFELVFMSAKYVEVGIMAFIVGMTFVHLCRGERNTLTRLRLGLLSGTALMASFYGVSRTAFVLLSYFSPACPFLGGLRAAEKGAQVAMCLTWPLAAMMSSKVYMTVNRPLEHLRKSSMLSDLCEVQGELSRLGVLTAWGERSIRRRSLDLRIYQALISILDGKRLLLTRLRAAENKGERNLGGAVSERMRSLQRREGEGSWDDALLGRARSLQQLLVSVDDGLDYHELVATYGRVGRTLRRGLA